MSQLTQSQRYTIEVMYQQNYSQTDIGKVLGKHKSVVSREIKRNKDERNGAYKSDLAQRKCKLRHSMKKKKTYFTLEIKALVDKWIIEKYSPEQIVGRAKKEGLVYVSIERIYQYIWQDKKMNGSLYKHLRNGRKRYRKRGAKKDKRGHITGKTNIKERSIEVEKREYFGDFEVDLIIGKNHKYALITANDRATGLFRMEKVASKEAHIVGQKIIEMLYDLKINTITSDNGKEFAWHVNIAQMLNIKYYFADAYCSWQRGSNENLNGLVRQYFPKKYEFDKITDDEVREVQEKINNRPRKRFGFCTPNEVYLQSLNNNGKVAFMT